MKMNPEEREKLKKEILNEIEVQKYQVQSLQKSVNPVATGNATGRPVRIEVIGRKAISRESLNFA